MTSTRVFHRHISRSLLQFLKRPATPSRLNLPHTKPLATVVLPNTRCLSSGAGARRQTYTDQTSTESKSADNQANENGEDDRQAMEDEAEYEHSVKQRILNASLNHVLDHGWSKKALEAGAQSEGLPPIAHGIFERGGADIINHFYRKCNSELADQLKQQVDRIAAEGEEKPKTRAFIQDAVQARLKMLSPFHSIWKEAMAIQTLPQNAPEAWRNLMNLCDDIWYYAGDRSTDFDWYTKRLSLAAIYKATEIYMLQDTSPDFQETWIFLENRLNDLNQLGSLKRSLEPLKEGIMGLLSMGRNMAGMNSRDR